MGFVDPGKNRRSRIAGLRERSRPNTPPLKGPRSVSPLEPPPPRKRTRHSSSRSATPLTPYTTPTPLSRLESLPAEILHAIFAHTFNPSLPRTSLRLARLFSGARYLQLSYLRAISADPDALTRALAMRFFDAGLLALWERRYGEMLNLVGVFLPVRLVREPWEGGRLGLWGKLRERGAVLEGEERDVVLGVLHEAVRKRRGDVVCALVEAGLKVDAMSLRLAVREVGAVGLGVCRVLVGAGADMGGVEVWREALALERGKGGDEAVGWLLEGAAPPGEVLGELSLR